LFNVIKPKKMANVCIFLVQFLQKWILEKKWKLIFYDYYYIQISFTDFFKDFVFIMKEFQTIRDFYFVLRKQKNAHKTSLLANKS
jgi:hypothetical protein